jgi:hypothetical protein
VSDAFGRLPDLVNDRVGGFFHNTRSISGVTCQVCSGPGDADDLCGPCRAHRLDLRRDIADRVLTLTYARGRAHPRHQSAFHMWAYKQPSGPSTRAAEDLALMVLAATHQHSHCIEQVAGRPCDAVTYVPSTTRPGPEHPVAQLARHVRGLDTSQRFRLTLGPSATRKDRAVLPDRFIVEPQYVARVKNRHVLIVDDTWTSGAKAQSAALATRDAGAAQITVLCVARWLRNDWSDHRALLDRCSEPYDALVCPVTRGTCP